MSTTPEQRLWQAVLAQAINDATRESASSADDRRAMLEARAWLDRGGYDFQRCCTFAGLDPDAVREAWRAGRLTHVGSTTNHAHHRGSAGRAQKSRKRPVAADARISLPDTPEWLDADATPADAGLAAE